MDDKLAKLGYRLRKGKRAAPARPGAITFDERGNAVYEWKSSRLKGDSKEAETLREIALDHPGLTIVDDEPSPKEAVIPANPKGLRLGYNPYQSGMLGKKISQRKTDLRELSRWIEMKRRLEAQKKNSKE